MSKVKIRAGLVPLRLVRGRRILCAAPKLWCLLAVCGNPWLLLHHHLCPHLSLCLNVPTLYKDTVMVDKSPFCFRLTSLTNYIRSNPISK